MYAHYNSDPRQQPQDGQQQQQQQQGAYPPPHPHAAPPYGYEQHGHGYGQQQQQNSSVIGPAGYHNHSHNVNNPGGYNNYDPHHAYHHPPASHEYPPAGYYNPTPPQSRSSHMPPPGSHVHPGSVPPPQSVSSSTCIASGASVEQQHRGGGIVNPHDHDVLCGRGGATNSHIGNTNYRKLVSHNKRLYITCPKRHKIIVSRSIVEAVRRQNPPGRFLLKENDGLWHDIGHAKALEKTSQALREGAIEIRKEIQAEKNDPNPTKRAKSAPSKRHPEAVNSNHTVSNFNQNNDYSNSGNHVSLAKTESSDDSHLMPPPQNMKPSSVRRGGSILKAQQGDDMSTSSKSKKDRVVWDEGSINTGKSKNTHRHGDGLNDGERDALARLNRVSGSRSSSSRNRPSYSDEAHSTTDAYAPTSIASSQSLGVDLGDGLMSMPSISLSDMGISLGSFGMASQISGSMKNGTFNGDDMSVALINEVVLGSSRSIGMNSVPSLGSVSKDWLKAKNAMSYDELSQMMEDSIKSFQSLGFESRKDDDL